MTFWPLVAYAGGQGFTAMLGLAAIAALAYLRPGGRGLIALGSTLLFALWAAVSSIWSPSGDGIVSGSLSAGDFAVDAAGLRIFFVALAAAAVLAALMRDTRFTTPESTGWIAGAILVNGAIILAFACFPATLFAFFDPLSDAETEALQNAIRNTGSFALALPVLGAAVFTALSRPALGLGLAALAVLATLYAGLRLSADSAIVMPVVSGLAIGLVALLPKRGFQVLLAIPAGLTVAAPLLYLGLIKALDLIGTSVPGSFQSRLWSWEAVIAQTGSKPVLGHGLEASSTWRETFADHPEKLAMVDPSWTNYPLIPGHPHSMPLEIWAETGAIGAVLAASALFAIGLSLPNPGTLPPRTRFAIAGLVGAAFVTFTVSYSAWNEAYWASIALMAGSIFIVHRCDHRAEAV